MLTGHLFTLDPIVLFPEAPASFKAPRPVSHLSSSAPPSSYIHPKIFSMHFPRTTLVGLAGLLVSVSAVVIPKSPLQSRAIVPMPDGNLTVLPVSGAGAPVESCTKTPISNQDSNDGWIAGYLATSWWDAATSCGACANLTAAAGAKPPATVQVKVRHAVPPS